MKTQVDTLLASNNFWVILAYVIVVLFIAWLLSRILRTIIITSLKSKKETVGKTTLNFFKHSIKFLVGVLAVFFIIFTVPLFRAKAGFIFSGAGILAAIIGFAAQAAISNLIAGAFIVIFKPFRVGDYIRLDQQRLGIVQDITLRHTIINNFENKRLIIPNSVISTESVLNHTIEDSNILSFNNIKVGLYADVDKAKQIIQEEAVKLEGIIDNRTPEQVLKKTQQIEVRVVEVNETHILLRAYIWLGDPFKEFKIKCALKEVVHKRFVIENIDLPVPIYRLSN